MVGIGAASWVADAHQLSGLTTGRAIRGMLWGQTTEVLVGGRWGGCGQHGGPFSGTQGAPIIISFCKASFKLLRYPVSEQNHFLFDFVNQSRRYNNY